MTFNLTEIFATMNIFSLGVAAALGIMAIASLTVFVERWSTYWRSEKRSLAFGPIAAKLLSEDDFTGLAEAASDAKPSYLASMLASGVSTYNASLQVTDSDVSAPEMVKRELARKGDAQAAQLKRGLSVLASVGSTAPFVGLLGTVIGIIGAFEGIAAEGSGGLGAVSSGIAEALVVTALGLVVAIPSVLIFNFLSTRSDRLLLELDQSRGQFVDYLESRNSRHLAMCTSQAPAVAKDTRANAA